MKREKADSEGAGESKGSEISGDVATLLIGVPVVRAGAAGGVYVWCRCRRGEELGAKNTEDLVLLSKRAVYQLLETNDGVRGAVTELEFACAEFGIEATKQFAEALASAQDSMQKVFVVRQGLSDDIPETPQQQWEMDQRVLALITSARESITAQEQGFRNLGNLSARVDQHLAELQTRADEPGGQRNILMAEIDNLILIYSQAAFATLRTCPDQITTLVTGARSSITSGRHSTSEGKRSEAVAFARMTEETLGYVAAKAEEVKEAHGSLDDVFQGMHAALASISSDVVDVKRPGAGNPVTAAKQIDVERTITARSNGDVDPIKALSELAATEDTLDAALVDVRSADKIRKRKKEASQRNRGIAQQTIDRVEKIEGYGRYTDQRAGTLPTATRGNVAKGDSVRSPDAKDDCYKTAVSAADRAEDRVVDPHERDSHRYDYDTRDGSGIGRTMGSILAGMVLGSLFDGRNDDRHGGGFSAESFFGGDSNDDGFSLGSFFGGDSDDDGGFDFGSGDGGGFDFDFGSDDGGSSQNFISTLPKGTDVAEKQTILGRITQLAKASINALLDGAKNPQRMFNQMIRDCANSIAEAQGAVAVTVGNLRLAQADYQEGVKASRKWGQRALAASNKAEQMHLTGDKQGTAKFDNLAKITISKQMVSEREAKDAEPLIASRKEVVVKLKDDLDQMRSKFDELKTKRNRLVTHTKMAEAQNRVQDTISPINILNPISELGRYEDQIRRQEALAQSKAEVAVPSLGQQFTELKDHSQDIGIEARLAALKGGGTPAQIEAHDFSAY